MRGKFLQERIDATKKQIVQIEDAVAALDGGIESYTLDTGQSRQTVTRANTAQLIKTLDSLYNRLATLEARAGTNGGGVVVARPRW